MRGAAVFKLLKVNKILFEARRGRPVGKKEAKFHWLHARSITCTTCVVRSGRLSSTWTKFYALLQMFDIHQMHKSSLLACFGSWAREKEQDSSITWRRQVIHSISLSCPKRRRSICQIGVDASEVTTADSIVVLYDNAARKKIETYELSLTMKNGKEKGCYVRQWPDLYFQKKEKKAE